MQPRDPRLRPSLHTDRTFAEIAGPYQIRSKGRRTFETVHSRDNGPDDGDTVLHKAAVHGSLQDVLDLVKLGASVNALGDMGDTPLHAAARGGHAKVADALLKAGASPTIRNEWGETPVDTAAKNGHQALARDLGCL